MARKLSLGETRRDYFESACTRWLEEKSERNLVMMMKPKYCFADHLQKGCTADIDEVKIYDAVSKLKIKLKESWEKHISGREAAVSKNQSRFL